MQLLGANPAVHIADFDDHLVDISNDWLSNASVDSAVMDVYLKYGESIKAHLDDVKKRGALYANN